MRRYLLPYMLRLKRLVLIDLILNLLLDSQSAESRVAEFCKHRQLTVAALFKPAFKAFLAKHGKSWTNMELDREWKKDKEKRKSSRVKAWFNDQSILYPFYDV
jgi:hypothetical protein